MRFLTVNQNTEAVKVLSIIQQGKNTRYLVTDNQGNLTGIITLKDLLDFLSIKLELEPNENTGREVMEYNQ